MPGRFSGVSAWFCHICWLAACAGLGVACGGSVADSSNSTDAGGTTGTSAQGGAGTTSVGGASVGGTSTGGGTAISSICLQPAQPGNCEAYMPSYYFDPMLGRCQSFVYGGCGGNENRFSTLMDCVATCDPGGLDRCKTASDCRLGGDGCCGTCEPVKLADFIAMTATYAAMPNCPGVACGACPPYEGLPTYPNFGVRCIEHRCQAYDVRESDSAVCTLDTDCRLRAGLGCCELCGTTNGWVAINRDPIANAAFCDSNVTCDACIATPPATLRAVCASGRCQVAMNL